MTDSDPDSDSDLDADRERAREILDRDDLDGLFAGAVHGDEVDYLNQGESPAL